MRQPSSPITPPRGRQALTTGLAALLVAAVAGACGSAAAPSVTAMASAGATASASPTPTPTPSPTPTPTPTPFPTGPINLVFGPAGTMTRPRSEETITALADGRVLVAGGYWSATVSSAEIWDPVTHHFTTTGSMAAARSSATATLLLDGRVLVAGGMGNTGTAADGTSKRPVLASAELYDPATGAWSPTGSMTTPRATATATRLADGRVLIAGGFDSHDCVATAELYDPATGTFSPTGSIQTCLSGHSATLLADGRVLLAGGMDKTKVVQTIQLYDPRSGQFEQVMGQSAHGGLTSVVTLLDGRVLICGGDRAAQPELFDPVTDTTTPTGSFVHARWYEAAVLLPNGRVLIAGGYEKLKNQTKYPVLASLETYDPATGKFSAAGSLQIARVGADALVLPNGVLIVGGSGAAGSSDLITIAEFAPFGSQ